MGNKSSSPKGALPKKDLALHSKSGFSEKEIQALYGQFLSLATSGGGLTQSEFQAALGFKGRETSLFLERVFKQMDVDHDGKLTFAEFINGVAVFSSNSTEKKYRFTFALYADGKDRILPADLRTTLSAVLRENDVVLSDGQVDRLVADTFTTYDRNHDGAIDFEEYHDMCVQNPALLKHLTINVSEVLAGGGATA